MNIIRTMNLKFIDIRDINGRQSGFTVHKDTVAVRGMLEHGTEFTKKEMMKLAYQIATTCADVTKHNSSLHVQNDLDTTEERELNCKG